VVDDVVAVVGGDGSIIATDETVVEVTAGGDIVIDETISAVGGDGELHIIEEDVTLLETSKPAKRTPAKKAVKRTPAKRTPAKKAGKRTVKKAVKRTPMKRTARR
jgi:hypothetical protein